MRLLSVAVIAVPNCILSSIEAPTATTAPPARRAAPAHRTPMVCDAAKVAGAQLAHAEAPSLANVNVLGEPLSDALQADVVLGWQLDGLRLAGHCDTASVIAIEHAQPLYTLARTALYDSASKPPAQAPAAAAEVLDIVALSYRMRGSAMVTVATSQALELTAAQALEHLSAGMDLAERLELASDIEQLWTGRPPVGFEGMFWSDWVTASSESTACADRVLEADRAAAEAWSAADPVEAFAALPRAPRWERTLSPAARCSSGVAEVMERMWTTERDVEAEFTRLLASLRAQEDWYPQPQVPSGFRPAAQADARAEPPRARAIASRPGRVAAPDARHAHRARAPSSRLRATVVSARMQSVPDAASRRFKSPAVTEEQVTD